MLGVGSSAGTPVIGCKCLTCLSDNPKNKRLRCSAAVTTDDGNVILIDTGPDLRAQAIRAGIDRVNAVLYTHTHADHLHGIDDLRAFCQIQKQQIPLYGKADAMQHIQQKFGYTIREASNFWEVPVLSINPVSSVFDVLGINITPIPIKHGYSDIFGYRIGKMAYLTDVSEVPQSSLEQLRGLDVLILDCLRYSPHHTHINVEQSIAYAGLIKARETYLIHMTHDLEYEKLSAELPNHIHVAYDGLKLNF